MPPHAKLSRFRNPVNVFSWNTEPYSLEFRPELSLRNPETGEKYIPEPIFH